MAYRDTASFGKRIEFYLIGLMLKEGLDCYIPLVDDDGIDVVIRKSNGQYIEVQIKARSNDAKEDNAAFFAAINHRPRDNYYFLFYSEQLNKKWILSSQEFIDSSTILEKGTGNIKFNGCKTNKKTGIKEPYALPKFDKYIDENFSRFKNL